jgi:predicted phosphodiesterase
VRIAVISDVHANLVALERVLDHAGSVDAVWCLGDIVGYGPRPNEVVALLRARGALAVAGNHDWATTGKMDVADFNRDAAAAARWTATALDAGSSAYLAGLNTTETSGDFTLVHGSPRDPIWEYLLAAWQAEESLDHFATRFCLFGHTHLPSLFAADDRGRMRPYLVQAEETIDLSTFPDRALLNPGSVGQPRDGDSRAGYLLLDLASGLAHWRRVGYAVDQTQRQMRAAGLPRRLVDRLAHGR